MISPRLAVRLAPALALIALATPAQAAYILASGQSVSNPIADAANPFASAATILGPFSASANPNSNYFLTLTEAAYYRSGIGLAFQIVNRGTEPVVSIDLSGFAGYTTIVGYTTAQVAGFAAGTAAPVSIARNGGVLTFNFGSLAGGSASYVFFVQTNATQVSTNGVAPVRGTQSSVNFSDVYGAAGAVVPEPSSAVLLGIAAAGLGAATLRRRRAA